VTDRAVSDVVGYVLIFSLIVTTVGVVTATGYGTLEDRQTAERINNVERAFDVLADNVEDVYREGAPSRATEMRLAGGELRHGEPVTVRIEDRSDPSVNVTTVSRPLVYADGDTEIVYAAGAVLRSDGGASIMLRDPPFYSGSEAVFPLVGTYRTGGQRSVDGDGTVRITSTGTVINTTVPEPFAAASAYNVTVESPRSDAWAQYFESDPGFGAVERGNGTVEAEIEGDQVRVVRSLIRVRLSA